MNVLSISYGRQLFAADNVERVRLRACAETVDALHMVVFTRTSSCLSPVVDGKLLLHPTNARTRIGMLLAAYRTGSRLLSDAADRSEWILSSQDPFEAGLVGYLLSLRYGVPLRVEEHADFFGTPHWRHESFLNRLRAGFGSWLLGRASCVRTVSQRTRAHLVKLGVTPERVAVTPVAVELAPFLDAGRVRASDAASTGTAPVVLSAGRLVKQKNLGLLLSAFAQVLRRGIAARLVFVGSGPEEMQLKRHATSLGIEEQVSFRPWVEDVPALMREADVFALSSHYEGWGRIILEAMAAGLPSVVTEVGCVGEVFLDGRHGLAVSVGDEEAFADALARLLEDAPRRRVYGERAARDVAAYAAAQPPYPEAWRRAFAPCLRSPDQKG